MTARLILNGRLADEAGRRVGKPDLLVHAPSGYRAIDVKFHRALDVADPSRESDPALVSDLSSPSFEAAREDLDFNARRNEGDLLQLAHYQRMLEAMGMAAEDGRFAGIIGTDRLVVWYDLDAAVWKTPALSEKSKLRSTMERYDFEFDFRLDIIAVARQHQLDSAIDLLVVPVRCAECPDCPWSEHCGPILEAPPGDVSLLPRIGWTQWKVHRDHGVNNRAQLAALDVGTAELVGQGVDVARLLEATEDLPPTLALGSLDEGFVGARELRALDDAGFVTVGDLARLCRRTASYSGSGLKSLPAQIDLSRAALGPEAVYSRRGIEEVSVPRADVEVDVDMENVEDGCYLWGCLVTDRSGADLVLPGYRAFVTWEPMTPDVETANSLAFWRWLMDLRTVTHAAGRTFRAYCYSASAENTYLRRVGLAAGIVEEVGSFIASDEWVDMLKRVGQPADHGRTERPEGSCAVDGIPVGGGRPRWWRVDDQARHRRWRRPRRSLCQGLVAAVQPRRRRGDVVDPGVDGSGRGSSCRGTGPPEIRSESVRPDQYHRRPRRPGSA